jgi:hypothetical protein
MEAKKSSLYREIENLILWFIPVGNNIPKDFALRNLGERMQNEMLDAKVSLCRKFRLTNVQTINYGK